ncbi:MAG: hypothetical protein AB2417_13685 [Clostridiaceae bacterium]
MLLQERIEELGSGILTITNSKVELIGFTCPERLNDYYYNKDKCYFSVGLYDLESLDFSRIQDNALFVVDNKDNNTLHKYHFELLKKDTIKYKDNENKMLTRQYHIRKCKYTNKFSYKDMNVSILFDTKEELLNYFKDRFKKNLFF